MASRRDCVEAAKKRSSVHKQWRRKRTCWVLRRKFSILNE